MRKLLVGVVVLWSVVMGSRLWANEGAGDLLQSVPKSALGVIALDAREDNPSVRAVTTEQSKRSHEILEAWALALGHQLLIELSRELDIRKDVADWLDPVFVISFLPGKDGEGKLEPLLLAQVRDEAAAAKGVAHICEAAAGRKFLKVFTKQEGDLTLTHVVVTDPKLDVCYLVTRGLLVATQTIDTLKDWASTDPKSASFVETAGGQALAALPEALVRFYVNVGGLRDARVLNQLGDIIPGLGTTGGPPTCTPDSPTCDVPATKVAAAPSPPGGQEKPESPKEGAGVPVESVVGAISYLDTGARTDLRVFFKSGVDKKTDEALQSLAEGREPDPEILKAAPKTTLAALLFSDPARTLKVAGVDTSGPAMWLQFFGVEEEEAKKTPPVPESVTKLLGGDLAMYLPSVKRLPEAKKPESAEEINPANYVPLLAALLAPDEDTATSAMKDLCDWLGKALKLEFKDVESSQGQLKSAGLRSEEKVTNYGYLATTGRFFLFSRAKEDLEAALARIEGGETSLADVEAFQTVRDEIYGKMPVQVYMDSVQLMTSSLETALEEANRANPYARKAIEMAYEGLHAFGAGVSVEKDTVRGSLFVGMDYQKLEEAQSVYMMAMPAAAIGAAVAFPVFARAREKAKQASCQSNLKQLALGMLMYAQDYDEKLPEASKWAEGIKPYIKNEAVFRCPSDTEGAPCGYAMNANLSRRSTAGIKLPAETILLFDATGKSANPYGTGNIVALRHNGGANLAFADGHVKWVHRIESGWWGVPQPKPKPAPAKKPPRPRPGPKRAR